MAHKILIIIFLAATVYLALENAQLKKDLQERTREAQTDLKMLQQQKSTDADLRQKLSTEEALRQQQKASQNDAETRTARELQAQQARVAQLKQSINDRRGNVANTFANDAQRLQMNKGRIQDLENKLKQALQARKEVGQTKNQTGQIQKTQTKNELEYANGQIRLQEEAIKSTQGQLNFWLRQKKDTNAPAKITEYEQQLKNQRDSLQLMQQQKLQIKNNLQSKTATLQNQAAEETADIQDSEGQIRAQLSQLQQEKKELQAAMSTTKKSEDQNQTQRRQLQQSLDQETAKLRNLETELQKEMAELKKYDN
jgi:hypothetical protein